MHCNRCPLHKLLAGNRLVCISESMVSLHVDNMLWYVAVMTAWVETYIALQLFYCWHMLYVSFCFFILGIL